MYGFALDKCLRAVPCTFMPICVSGFRFYHKLFFLFNFCSCIRHQYCPQSMLRSGGGQSDYDSVLDSKKGGGALTIIDSGIHPYTSVVMYRESDVDRLDVWRPRGRVNYLECFW